MMSPDQLGEIREEMARKAIVVGHLKLLSSSLHYAWCVKASMQGNGLGESKAVAEIEAALAHITEAAHVLGVMLQMQNEILGVKA